MIKYSDLIHGWDPNTPGQSVPGNNGNEGVFHITQNLKDKASTSDKVLHHIQNTNSI